VTPVTELPKVVAEAASIEEAFEAYSKTPGGRHPMWNGNLTLSKFKRRFGKAFDAKQTPADAATNVLDALRELFAGAGLVLPGVEATQEQAVQEAPREPQARSVQPENLMQPPTNKMVWLLRMQALDVGISTSFKCPLFRGQASELIGKIKAAGDDKAKIRRLLEA
jgi:hypothetical protein